jgi:hypothetical protein
MDWLGTLISVLSVVLAAAIGSFIGGYFTLKAAKMSISHEDETSKKKELAEAKEKRPELEIESFTGTNPFDRRKPSDLSLLFVPIERYEHGTFAYPKEALSDSHLVEDVIKLKNVGGTDISALWVSSNLLKSTSLFEYYGCRNYSEIENGFYSCKACRDRVIRRGEEISIKIISISDRRLGGFIGASLSVWLLDVNGRWWSQALFFPDSKIYHSELTTQKDFKDYTDESVCLECFADPMKW